MSSKQRKMLAQKHRSLQALHQQTTPQNHQPHPPPLQNAHHAPAPESGEQHGPQLHSLNFAALRSTSSSSSDSDTQDSDDDQAPEPPRPPPSPHADAARRPTRKERKMQNMPHDDDGEPSLPFPSPPPSSSVTSTAAPSGPSEFSQRVEIDKLDQRYLDVSNELANLFGRDTVRKVAAAERQQHNGHAASRRRRACLLIQPADDWPPISPGLDMELAPQSRGAPALGDARCATHFVYTHSRAYREAQQELESAVAAHNINGIQELLMLLPYHAAALLHFSSYLQLTGQHELSAELVCKALHACEAAMHPLCRARMLEGAARLSWEHEPNRPLFIALFRHAVANARRGCHKTALEQLRLLYSLDPDRDPMNALLHLDHCALSAGRGEWLLALPRAWPALGLPLYPSFAVSLALARRARCPRGAGRRLDGGDEPEAREAARADAALERALLLFPELVPRLIDSVSPGEAADLRLAWERNFGTAAEVGATVDKLLRLYVVRSTRTWQSSRAEWGWLLSTARAIVAKVEAGEDGGLRDDLRAVRAASYGDAAAMFDEFADVDAADFSHEPPAALPADVLAANGGGAWAAAGDGGAAEAAAARRAEQGRLVVPLSERLALRPETHFIKQFFLSLLPWASPPPRRRAP